LYPTEAGGITDQYTIATQAQIGIGTVLADTCRDGARASRIEMESANQQSVPTRKAVSSTQDVWSGVAAETWSRT